MMCWIDFCSFTITNKKIENENENKISATINSTTKQSVSVIASVRDKIYFASNCDVDNTNKKFVIPTESMPMGVCKITIFNQENFDWIKNNVFKIAGEFHLINKELKSKLK